MPFCCDTFSNSGAYACSADLNDPNRNAVIDRQLDESCVKYGVTITRPSPPPPSRDIPPGFFTPPGAKLALDRLSPLGFVQVTRLSHGLEVGHVLDFRRFTIAHPFPQVASPQGLSLPKCPPKPRISWMP